jgi:hypothetical protein
MPLLPFQYNLLKQWCEGNFTGGIEPPLRQETVVEALDRAALEACVGASFRPGIETWKLITKSEIWGEFCRINAGGTIRASTWAEVCGFEAKDVSGDVPIRPGILTEGNAVPWQADFQDCHWKEEPSLGWWPAQRPDHVRTTADSPQMVDWLEQEVKKEEMIKIWHQLGFVIKTVDSSGRTVFTESERVRSRH